MKHAKKHKLLLASLFIFFSAFMFRLWGIKEAGGTWDEDVYYNSAYHYYFNFKTLDFSRASWGWNFEHPPVAKYIYLPGAYLSQKLPNDPAFRPGVNYLPLRIESAILGALTCVFIFLIGLHIFKSFWVGVYSGVILAFLPQFAAYGKLVSLESPQTFFLTGVLYFSLKLFTREVQSTNYKRKGIAPLGWFGGVGVSPFGWLKRKLSPLRWLKTNSNFVLLALFTALAFATRFSSGLVFLWMGLVLVVRFIVRAEVIRSREPISEKASRLLVYARRSKGKDILVVLFVPFALLALSFAFLFLIWPWLWHDPINDFIKSFTFSGQHFKAGEGESFYYFRYLWYTTPVLVLLTGFMGFIEGVRKFKLPTLALIVWILVFAGQGFTGLKGGGVRYSLMAFPAIAILSGLGISLFFERAYPRVEKFYIKKILDSASLRSNITKIALTSTLVLYLVANSLTVYPYLMNYYSETVGLVWGAEKKQLPFGFRGEGIKRTIDWLNTNATQNANVAIIATPDEAPSLRADLTRQENPQSDTDYLVVLPPYAFDAGEDWELVYEEKVANVATLAVIYRSQ